MVSRTNRAVGARRQQSLDRIDRLVARGALTAATREGGRQRVSQSLGSARRRLRALAAAQRAVAALEVEIGRALLRVEAEGLSRNEAFARVNLRRHVGRKYIAAALSAQNRREGASSTGGDSSAHVASAPAHVETNSRLRGARDEKE